MRKAIFLAMLVGGLVGMLRPQAVSAQTATKPVYAVKFVCGLQLPTATPPAEPPVKPGNYATKINVETLTPAPTGSTYSWFVSIPGRVSSLQSVVLSQFHTEDITCTNIVLAAFPSPTEARPSFINGYVNILPGTGAALAVTAVYTSQGCAFDQSGDSQGGPICGGPVSIEVVPETALAFTPPT